MLAVRTTRVRSVENTPPFDFLPLPDGRYELRAFSDNSDDPIYITLDEDASRRLAHALGNALSLLDGPQARREDFQVEVGDRLITVTSEPGAGLRLTVTR